MNFMTTLEVWNCSLFSLGNSWHVRGPVILLALQQSSKKRWMEGANSRVKDYNYYFWHGPLTS
jgi:hypothetical protein